MYRSYNGKLAVSILFCGLFLITGAAAETLTFDQSLDRALAKDRSIYQAELNLQGARMAVENRWAWFLPSMSVELGGGLTGSMLSGEGFTPADDLSWSGSVELSMNLRSGLSYSIRNDLLTLAEAELSLEEAVRDVEYRLLGAYYQLLLSQEEMKLLEEDLRLAENQLEQSQVRFANGLVSERVLLQSRLSFERSRLALERSVTALEIKREQFRLLIGLESGTPFHLAGEIEVDIVQIDSDELIARLLWNRTDLRQLELKNEQYQLNLESSRAERGISPSLNLSLSGGIGGPENLSASGGQSWQPRWQDSYRLSLALSLPLDGWIRGSRTDQAIQANERTLMIADVSLEDAVQAAVLEVRTMVDLLNQEKRSMELATLQVEMARRIYELSEDGFSRGTVERLELEESRKSLLSSQLELLNSNHSYIEALLALKQALSMDHRDAIG